MPPPHYTASSALPPEQRWLDDRSNRERYAGQWVALEGDQLLAHSHDFEDVLKVVKNTQPAPLVTRLDELNPLPFAGW